MFGRKEQLIGLDIGSHAAKVVQLHFGGSGMRLATVGMALFSPDLFAEGRAAKPERIAAVVQNLVRHLGIKTKAAAASVSGNEVIVKKVDVPMMTEEELEKRMQLELGHYIPYSISEVDLDYQVMEIPKDRPNFMEVLLVAAKKESVNEHVNLVKLCDLEPMVIDVDFFALCNAFEATYGFEDKNLALIDIGASKAIMNIVCRGVPVFTRGIAIGGRQITEKIEDLMGESLEDAERVKLGNSQKDVPRSEMEAIFSAVVMNWVSECRKAINLFHMNFPDNPIEQVYLSGGSSRLPGLAGVFEEHLGVQARIFNPLSQLEYDPKVLDPAYVEYVGPQMAIAFGLAMRKVREK